MIPSEHISYILTPVAKSPYKTLKKRPVKPPGVSKKTGRAQKVGDPWADRWPGTVGEWGTSPVGRFTAPKTRIFWKKTSLILVIWSHNKFLATMIQLIF